MPSVITHNELGRRVLARLPAGSVADERAFLLGAQGPDLFFFFRAYPWMLGKAGLPIGNALHEARPSALLDAFFHWRDTCPAAYRAVVDSYVRGFLCHYAADRVIHPFVHHLQEQLRVCDPAFANTTDPYHYVCESALDVALLHARGERASSFRLISLMPPATAVQRDALAWLYHRLLHTVLDIDLPEATLRHLVSDFRQTLWFMNDRLGIKRPLLHTVERVLRIEPRFSALVRTDKTEYMDFENAQNALWVRAEGSETHADFGALCDEAVALAVSLIDGFENGQNGLTLTDDVDFTGQPYEGGQ
ncbi:MAG: zinc dependent phospholipase C family protein [Clostridia bacterium]|nr:zinc dependent phospholipase C family protein [Clostridia bacterium]